MKDDLADITVILDRSGSMSVVRDDAIGGFNSFLDEQKTAPGRAGLTLVQFDNEYEVVHAGKPIADVPPLTAETYVPRGGTALLDAMGRTINEAGARFSAMAEDDRPGKVVFVVLTDGEENSSREFARDKVMEMVRHQTEAYGWTFLYLGANQDAIKVGRGLGLAASNSMSFMAGNVDAVMRSTSRNMASYRAGAVAKCNYSEGDRAEAMAMAMAPKS